MVSFQNKKVLLLRSMFVRTPAMYHIPGPGKGLSQVKVHTASMPRALVVGCVVFWRDKHYAAGFVISEIYAVIRRSIGIDIGLPCQSLTSLNKLLIVIPKPLLGTGWSGPPLLKGECPEVLPSSGFLLLDMSYALYFVYSPFSNKKPLCCRFIVIFTTKGSSLISASA